MDQAKYLAFDQEWTNLESYMATLGYPSKRNDIYIKTDKIQREGHSDYYQALFYHLVAQALNVKKVLIIGFNAGHSTIAFTSAGCTVDVVDICKLTYTRDCVDRLSGSINKFFEGRSSKVLPLIEEHYDLVLVDGDHSYKSVKSDIEHTKLNTKYFIFDDSCNKQVTKAIQEHGLWDSSTHFKKKWKFWSVTDLPRSALESIIQDYQTTTLAMDQIHSKLEIFP